MSNDRIITSNRLIGFDCRLPPSLAEKKTLSHDRREACLLKPEEEFVLTADRSIWCSCFQAEGGWNPCPEVGVEKIQVSETNQYFVAFDLWNDALAMRKAVEALKPIAPSCGIAFGLTIPEKYSQEFVSDSWFDAIFNCSGVVPANAGPDWPFLGFDVVNSGFTSALSGFGPLDDIDDMRAKYGPQLNRFSLFGDQSQSLEFCNIANQRYNTDDPFYSLAMYLLWDGSGEIKGDLPTLRQQN